MAIGNAPQTSTPVLYIPEEYRKSDTIFLNLDENNKPLSNYSIQINKEPHKSFIKPIDAAIDFSWDDFSRIFLIRHKDYPEFESKVKEGRAFREGSFHVGTLQDTAALVQIANESFSAHRNAVTQEAGRRRPDPNRPTRPDPIDPTLPQRPEGDPLPTNTGNPSSQTGQSGTGSTRPFYANASFYLIALPVIFIAALVIRGMRS